MNAASGLNADFLDMLDALLAAGVDFIVVGAHALALHGVPRATGDLDLLVRPTPDNAARVIAALRAFGAPIEAHGVQASDFAAPGAVYQLGMPPRRIDLLTQLSGLSFDQAWQSRVEVDLGERRVPFLGREALRANKRAAGRDKDLLDLKILEQGEPVR